jgi:hypothetical protein
MPVIIMGDGLFGCFVCECEAVVLALSLFSVFCFSDFYIGQLPFILATEM